MDDTQYEDVVQDIVTLFDNAVTPDNYDLSEDFYRRYWAEKIVQVLVGKWYI